MKIEPVGLTSLSAHSAPVSPVHRKAAVPASAKLEPIDSLSFVEPIQRDDVHSVVSKLEAGHFRGVAAVRLQINFFEELQARANARTTETIKVQAETLAGQIVDQARELLEPLATSPEQIDELNQLLKSFQEVVETLAGESQSPAQTTDGIKAAFEKLIADAEALLSPNSVETPTENPESPDTGLEPNSALTTPKISAENRSFVEAEAETLQPLTDGEPAEPPADSTTDQTIGAIEEALAALKTAFEEALEAFTSATAVSTWPAIPTGPNGNGVAFEKFLTQLQAMQSGTFVDEDA